MQSESLTSDESTERRIGLMGSKPITAGYIRSIELRAKEMRLACKCTLPTRRQKRLPNF